MEADGFQPAPVVIETVDPDMIELPEKTFSVLGFGYRRVLQCGRGIQGQGHLKDRSTTGSEEAVEFRHGSPVVRDVLQNVAADSQVERARLKRRVREVQRHVNVSSADIGGDVVERIQDGQTVAQRDLGSQVEQVHTSPPEDVCSMPQKEKQQAVPVKRPTLWAAHVVASAVAYDLPLFQHWQARPIRKQSPEPSSTEEALVAPPAAEEPLSRRPEHGQGLRRQGGSGGGAELVGEEGHGGVLTSELRSNEFRGRTGETKCIAAARRHRPADPTSVATPCEAEDAARRPSAVQRVNHGARAPRVVGDSAEDRRAHRQWVSRESDWGATESCPNLRGTIP